MDWNNNEFFKKRDPKGYLEYYRKQLSQDDKRISECVLCNTKFVKKHHNEIYCCDECRKTVRSQQSRNKAHKWYHKHKHELTEKQRWGLGSGTLGAHRHDDPEKELKVIENEFRNLRLKRKY